MNSTIVRYSAQDVVNAVHGRMHPDDIASSMRRMIEAMGGNLDVLDRLEPEGRLLYIVALVAAQP
jgi:poly-beta-hydroxyalkanoate depolymerase